MMMKKVVFGTMMFCLMAVVGFSQDATGEQTGPIADRINAKKMAFFTDKLQLSTDEFQNFWPLFTEYEGKQRGIRQQYRTKKAFKFMSDKEAETYVLNSFKMEEELLNLKKDYFQKFKDVLPIRKIAMLNKVDRQFKEALLRQMQQRNRQGRR